MKSTQLKVGIKSFWWLCTSWVFSVYLMGRLLGCQRCKLVCWDFLGTRLILCSVLPHLISVPLLKCVNDCLLIGWEAVCIYSTTGEITQLFPIPIGHCDEIHLLKERNNVHHNLVKFPLVVIVMTIYVMIRNECPENGGIPEFSGLAGQLLLVCSDSTMHLVGQPFKGFADKIWNSIRVMVNSIQDVIIKDKAVGRRVCSLIPFMRLLNNLVRIFPGAKLSGPVAEQ